MEYKPVFYDEDMNRMALNIGGVPYTNGEDMHVVAGHVVTHVFNMGTHRGLPAYVEVQVLGTCDMVSLWTVVVEELTINPLRTREYYTDMRVGVAVVEARQSHRGAADIRVTLRRI